MLASVWAKSVEADIAYSQEVGPFLTSSGIQGLLFKSTIGKSMNLIVFLENCDSSQLKVRQLDETIDTFERIVSGHKP